MSDRFSLCYLVVFFKKYFIFSWKVDIQRIPKDRKMDLFRKKILSNIPDTKNPT